MSEPNVRLLEVADRLRARTKAGVCHWTAVAGSPAFQTKVGDQLILVASVDADGNHPFSLGLWRRNPDPTDEAKWVIVDRVNTAKRMPGSAYPTWQKTIADLWQEARGDALKIDETIDAVLSELDG